ncbi:MAG TPA: toll/interleukin-1 receptor domain-containing protein [Candidatus Acidoferrales bacterium]|nr:toll/interleukin-1 receptor domain-containing protein [Candidatus Acidoferrales bacterium]
MAPAFISFVHEEIEWAECVQNFISLMFGSSAAPFMSSDKFQVYAGEKWLDRIMDELKEAKVVLLMLSENSVKRPWVNFEAGAAWTRDIVTIPICFGGLQKDNLPKPYSGLQAIDLESRDDHEYLARSVAHHLGIPEPMSTTFGSTALGGPESERVFRREQTAYNVLREKLSQLRSHPT